MRLPSIRFTVRSALISVASIAAWLAGIRYIEQRNHLIATSEWTSLEKQWWGAYAGALKKGENQAASFYKGLADRSTNERQRHQAQLGSFPRRLSPESWIVTVLYSWAVALCLVVRRERRGNGRTSSVRARLVRFIIWLGMGLISPIVMIVLEGKYERTTPYTGPRPWPATVIEVLFWLQGGHALLGVLVLRGVRWLVLGLGILLFLVTGLVAFEAIMAVTGIWL